MGWCEKRVTGYHAIYAIIAINNVWLHPFIETYTFDPLFAAQQNVKPLHISRQLPHNMNGSFRLFGNGRIRRAVFQIACWMLIR